MRDKQVFETLELPNGVTHYHYPEDVGFGIVSVTIPVGSAHNVAPIPKGAFHFLEHMIFHSSPSYPSKDSFERAVGLRGGLCDAETHPFFTKYTLLAPTLALPTLWHGLFEHLFQPIFHAADIEFERQVIRSERKEFETYYPGMSHLGQYLHSGWLGNMPRSLNQDLGDLKAWRAMNPAVLAQIQRHYLTKGIRVVSGGNVPLEVIQADCAQLVTAEQMLPIHHTPLHWVCPEYHTFETPDVSSPTLYVGGIANPKPDRATVVAMRLIGEFMTNHYHGPLVDWLRRTEGVYSISFDLVEGPNECYWYFRFGLRSQKQVARVRAGLLEHMRAALKDADWVRAEVARVLAAEIYAFQDIGKIIETAEDQLELHGTIQSVADCCKVIQQCEDTIWLAQVFEEYFAKPARAGSFCAVPLRRQPVTTLVREAQVTKLKRH